MRIAIVEWAVVIPKVQSKDSQFSVLSSYFLKFSFVNSTCLKAKVTEKEMAFYSENPSSAKGKEKSALVSLFYACPSTFRILQKD